jgi:hypothetical protein
MCLIKTEETARVATEPIKVYKILTADNRSPFRNYRYNVGENTAYDRDIFSCAGRTIDRGYLHAYLTASEAYQNLAILRGSLIGGRLLKVVEMYIPVGTEYWLGEGSEVAAERLVWPDTHLPSQ